MSKDIGIGTPLESRESSLPMKEIRSRLQPFDGFKMGDLRCLHTRGMIFIAPKTTTIKFKEIPAKTQQRYKKLLETLDKKAHWGLLVPILWTESNGETPGIVWLYSQTGDYLMPIQEVFYDLIIKRWKDATFASKDRTGRIVVRSKGANKNAKMKKGLVAVIRSYSVSD